MGERAGIGDEPGRSGPYQGQEGAGSADPEPAHYRGGFQDLQKALALTKYDDAMAYMNLLHRERADLADKPDAYKKDRTEADGWVDKTLATKKIKARRQESGGCQWEKTLFFIKVAHDPL